MLCAFRYRCINIFIIYICTYIVYAPVPHGKNAILLSFLLLYRNKELIGWNLLETFISIYKDIYKYLNIRKIEIFNIFRMYIACETHNYLYIEKAIVHIFRVYVSF